MKIFLFAISLIGVGLTLTGCGGGGGGGGGPSTTNLCDQKQTKLSANETAVVCYLGNFLTKMLTELNSGPAMGPTRKTVEHVRVHLLPYMGGKAQLAALRTDTPRTGNCTVCYGDNDTADALSDLRSQVPAEQTQIYDQMKICYMRLTDAIMDRLNKNDKGEFLVPLQKAGKLVEPEEQVLSLFQDLVADKDLSEYTGCEEVPSAPPRKQKDWAWIDVCDVKNHGLSDPNEAAVFCYVASFMSKMMWELNLCQPLGWCRKTEEHVRIHFTPYMGGSAVTAKVASDKPSDPNCTACYTDPLCAEHQEMWLDKPCCYDNSTTPRCSSDLAPLDVFRNSRKTFDALNICYVPFANYFMEMLPKVGHWLVAPESPEDPFTTALSITKTIFKKAGVRGCGVTQSVVV